MDVLLVEDDELVREVLADELSEAGFHVFESASAEEGLAQMDAMGLRPSALVTDVDLGRGMDGIALAREALHRWPGLPVVVITGNPQNLDRLAPDLRRHALSKPFRPALLVEELHGLAHRRRVRRRHSSLLGAAAR